jgi:hypothetical protein
MLPRPAQLMTVPASVTLICGFGFPTSPWWMGPTWTPVPAVQAPFFELPEEPAPEKKEVPQLVAVNGRIAQRVNDLRPCVKARLQRVVSKLPEGVTILVTSAHRTREEQASLRPTFGIKAKPGTSTHEDGRAVDVNVLVDGERISPRVQNKVIGKAMASEGFQYLGAKDPVHYSIPKDLLDTGMTEDPELEVPTWDELREIEAHNQHVEKETEMAYAPAPLEP